jgi:hypothetical protein
MYRRGFDKLGRPVFVARPVGTTSEDWALQTRYVVYNFEHAIASMAPGVEQVVWIIDYTQFSLTAAPPMAFSRGVLTTMSDHYPERMGAIFAINPPMMFRVLWGALSPFIPAKSKKLGVLFVFVCFSLKFIYAILATAVVAAAPAVDVTSILDGVFFC